MNRYSIRIPYSYTRFGTLSCFVYADDEDDAYDAARNYNNRESEDYDDGDSDGDSVYEYNDMTVELDEENVDENEGRNREHATDAIMTLPSMFVEDLIRI